MIKKFKTLDSNSRGSITLDEFKSMLEIRMHFFRDRIYSLFEEDMQKKGLKTMSFDVFIRLLSVFHPLSNREDKFKFMFRLYDFDGDGVVT